MPKPRWTTRIELFGHPKPKNRWCLYDPAGIPRAVFAGLGSDKPQRDLAKRIVDLLNGDAYLYEEEQQ